MPARNARPHPIQPRAQADSGSDLGAMRAATKTGQAMTSMVRGESLGSMQAGAGFPACPPTQSMHASMHARYHPRCAGVVRAGQGCSAGSPGLPVDIMGVHYACGYHECIF
jgi:hypothetical protein